MLDKFSCDDIGCGALNFLSYIVDAEAVANNPSEWDLMDARTICFVKIPATMKLWKGNIFSRVCHSVQASVPCDHYQWCIGTHHTRTPLPWPSLYRDPPSETCSYLFIISARTVGKRAVDILLECFLAKHWVRISRSSWRSLWTVLYLEHAFLSFG